MTPEKPVAAPIDAVVKCTLGLHGKWLTQALSEGYLTIDGKSIITEEMVSVSEGSVVECGGDRITVVPAHLINLRSFLKGDAPLGIRGKGGC